MFNHWTTVANENFEIFDEIFAILPNETVDAMPAGEGSFFGEEASEAYLQVKVLPQDCYSFSKMSFPVQILIVKILVERKI